MRSLSLVHRLVLVGVLAATASVGGVTSEARAGEPWSWGEGKGVKETRTILVDHVAARAVAVSTENGGISLGTTTDRGVTITAKVRAQDEERLKATQVLTKRLADGTLDVRVQWPDDRRKSNEGVTIEIMMPDANGVSLTTTNGGLSVAGMGGQATLATTNGGVSVKNQNGAVSVNSSNGNVSIDGAGPVTVKTSNGPIQTVNVAGPVKAQTSNGPAEIALRSDSVGPVECNTSNGPIRLTVGSGFGGSLKALTSNGGVKVSGVDAARVESKKQSAKVRFSDSGAESSLQTSNGRIVVKRE